MQRYRQFVVIGAGITGLTAAWQLRKNGKDVEVLECKNKIGGLMQTQTVDGFTMEQGPSTGTLKYPEVAELFEDLSGKCSIELPNSVSNRRLIWKGNKLHVLPSGIISGITTPLFTFKDKMRLLAEPWCKRGTDANESVGALAERRLGKSFVDYAVDPFIGGIYASNPYKIPTRLALPKLYALEQKYGSFIKGSIALSKCKKTEREAKATKQIFSTRGGFTNLVKALGDLIGKDRITLNVNDLEIEYVEGSWKLTWNGGSILAKNLITTCPAYSLPKLFSKIISKQEADILGSLYYAPIVNIGVGLNHSEKVRWKAFGALIPSCEKQKILGILMPSACFANRAPKTGATYAYFMGGTDHPEYLNKTDEEITEIVNDTLCNILKYPIGTKADVIRIFRHKCAIPQYMPDTDNRIATINAIEDKYQTLRIAGNIKDGIGMADRIAQAIRIANSLI